MYEKICSLKNLGLAFRKAKKNKTKKRYVKKKKKNLKSNLFQLKKGLSNQIYKPCKLKNFILRDPKTRTISKSSFKDRVVHHALCNIIVPVLSKSFIYDSYANQIGKGAHKALKRFDVFNNIPLSYDNIIN